ncbi:DUF4349 domain-containing protein [Candidatus Woesearchaeota archaeon]|nr:DUF4349 domain-containing protein [Candidatus Woesearchaeota archaeon]
MTIIVTLKEQFGRIKDNWLIAVIIVLLLLVSLGGNKFSSITNYADSSYSEDSAPYKKDLAASSRGGMVLNEGFAPEEQDRKITKGASLSSEVKRGSFSDAEQKFRNIVSSSSALIISENINKYGQGRDSYMYGSFYVKIDMSKYSSVISQFKDIGEVKSFSENSDDITESYTNAELNLELEKSRLERYNKMYNEATLVGDKITLNDRIFEQERLIKYLEDSLKNIDVRVEYGTVNVALTEKSSEYAGISLPKFSSLVKSLVGSFNSLLYFLFSILPWAIAAGIAALIWKWVKR